jgi:hypothetical protein
MLKHVVHGTLCFKALSLHFDRFRRHAFQSKTSKNPFVLGAHGIVTMNVLSTRLGKQSAGALRTHESL